MDERKRHKKGMKIRHAVLGDAHVERAQAQTSEFNAPRKTRSLLTIAMMVALNRSEELRMHLRAASNNGVTRKELQEVLLQAAIYCGVPAANTAFHMAEEVFAEK